MQKCYLVGQSDHTGSQETGNKTEVQGPGQAPRVPVTSAGEFIPPQVDKWETSEGLKGTVPNE